MASIPKAVERCPKVLIQINLCNSVAFQMNAQPKQQSTRHIPILEKKLTTTKQDIHYKRAYFCLA